MNNKDHMSIYSVKTHFKSTYTVNLMAIKACRFTVRVDLQCDYLSDGLDKLNLGPLAFSQI